MDVIDFLIKTDAKGHCYMRFDGIADIFLLFRGGPYQDRYFSSSSWFSLRPVERVSRKKGGEGREDRPYMHDNGFCDLPCHCQYIFPQSLHTCQLDICQRCPGHHVPGDKRSDMPVGEFCSSEKGLHPVHGQRHRQQTGESKPDPSCRIVHSLFHCHAFFKRL